MQSPEETPAPSAEAGETEQERPRTRAPRRRSPAAAGESKPSADAATAQASHDDVAAAPVAAAVEPEPVVARASPAGSSSPSGSDADRLMAEWQDALRQAAQPSAVGERSAPQPVVTPQPVATDEPVVTPTPVVTPQPVVRAPAATGPAAAPADRAVQPPSIAPAEAAAKVDDRPRAVETVLAVTGLVKRFGETTAVDGIDLAVDAGSFFGIVGPNGAGKTTTLSMITGLLRPDAGTVLVHGIDVWEAPERAKRAIGVLPDSLRLFDRLTGAQLLFYSGVLRGLSADDVRARSADLVEAFGLEDATGRLVADYSAGMTKKIALAAAMIHSPRLLVLDEPFESVDPVSATNIIDILQRYVHSGGTVVLSSHGMDLIQRVCDHVAVVIAGEIKAIGTTDEVRGDQSLEERFVQLAGGYRAAQGMEWLHSFTD